MTIQFKLDLSGPLGLARNQGSRGTCMAFAASDLNRTTAGAPDYLSPEFLYMSAGLLMSQWTPGDGLFTWAAIQAIHAPGQPLESDYPYQAENPATATVPIARAGKPMFTSDLAAHSETMQDIVNRLGVGYPVGLVIRLTDSFCTPSNGVVDARGSIYPNAYHAVLATGWGESKTSGRYLHIRNSWGMAWGDNGYAWLPEKFVALHVLESFGRK